MNPEQPLTRPTVIPVYVFDVDGVLHHRLTPIHPRWTDPAYTAKVARLLASQDDDVARAKNRREEQAA